MKFFFFVLKLAFMIWAFFKVSAFCEKQTDKFRLSRIFSTLQYDARWETNSLSRTHQKDVEAILSQKFTYLASGGQCYAFLSEDGASVIKFFKHHRRTLPTWIKVLPLPAHLAQKREKRLQKKEGKLLRDFASYKLSFERLKQETGVIYVHLNKTEHLNRQLKIVDKLGIEHKISLDDVEFVLQQKADLVYPHIKALVKNNDQKGAQKAIRSIVDLIVSRCQKGVFDQDPRIHRNFGFIEGKALIIDVGRLVNDPERKKSEVYIKDLHKITIRFKAWLVKKHPTLVPILDQEIERVTHEAI